jgi:hypothetical protein
VNNDNSHLPVFYSAFFGGFLVAQFIQMVHFTFEEFNRDKHAMHRSSLNGFSWFVLFAAAASARVVFGPLDTRRHVFTCYFALLLVLVGVGLKSLLYYSIEDRCRSSSFSCCLPRQCVW